MSAVRRRALTGLLSVPGLLLGPSQTAAQVTGERPRPERILAVSASIRLLGDSASARPRTPTPTPPPFESVARAPARTWKPGSRGLALAETLLGNFVPWLVNEYVSDYKDITRISPTTWRYNLQTGPVWDDNHFHVNMLMHPYQGNFYFNAARSNDFPYLKSFLFTVFGSALWECCGESHSASLSDLVTTTLGGVAIGEVLYRAGSPFLRPGKSRWWEIPVFLLTPSRMGTRWVLDHRNAPLEFQPDLDVPSHVGPFAALGWHGGDHVSLEIGLAYNELSQVRKGDAPFSHFKAALELNCPSLGGGCLDLAHLLGRFQIRGILWPLLARRASGFGYYLVPFHGVDYVNRLGNAPTGPFQPTNWASAPRYEFGGPSLGLAAAVSWGSPGAPSLVLSGDGHLLFGGIKSAYAYLAPYHDAREKERDREYDFGYGPGFGVAVSAGPFPWLHLSGFLRWNHIGVLHGSNFDGYDAKHRAKLYGFSVVLPDLLGPFGLGADGKFFRGSSTFGNPALAPVPPVRFNEWRLFVSWDPLGKPLGLFVF